MHHFARHIRGGHPEAFVPEYKGSVSYLVESHRLVPAGDPFFLPRL